jgi:hypothetical protein
VKRTEKEYMKTEGIIDQKVKRLIIRLGCSASNSSATEFKDDVQYDDQLPGTRFCMKFN